MVRFNFVNKFKSKIRYDFLDKPEVSIIKNTGNRLGSLFLSLCVDNWTKSSVIWTLKRLSFLFFCNLNIVRSHSVNFTNYQCLVCILLPVKFVLKPFPNRICCFVKYTCISNLKLKNETSQTLTNHLLWHIFNDISV